MNPDALILTIVHQANGLREKDVALAEIDRARLQAIRETGELVTLIEALASAARMSPSDESDEAIAALDRLVEAARRHRGGPAPASPPTP